MLSNSPPAAWLSLILLPNDKFYPCAVCFVLSVSHKPHKKFSRTRKARKIQARGWRKIPCLETPTRAKYLHGASGIEGKSAKKGILPSLWRPNCPKPLPRTKPWYTKVPLEDSDETCGEWKSMDLSNFSLDLTPSSSQPLPSALI